MQIWSEDIGGSFLFGFDFVRKHRYFELRWLISKLQLFLRD